MEENNVINKNKENTEKKFYTNKSFIIFTSIVGGLIILLLVFNIGMNVGFRKAGFSHNWGDNYHRNFAGPRQGFVGDFRNDDFIQSHGVFGQILKIEGKSLIINSIDNSEKVVNLNNDTIIRHFKDAVELSELKVEDYLVIIGEPNETGQIEAKLIRILPPPPQNNNFPNNRPIIPNSFPAF
ncbi:hypothetical protein JW977_01475 [Candidatus Falkowbacteria bacterium]|nr:hypothetical protein [Candidatus Falkowbacteria bacterium]